MDTGLFYFKSEITVNDTKVTLTFCRCSMSNICKDYLNSCRLFLGVKEYYILTTEAEILLCNLILLVFEIF